MKIVIVYNRDSKNVINLFGQPNQEKIGLRSIRRIVDALKSGGHRVQAIEGDKDLVDRLEEFMPKVMKGERPGMVFNISYGIQGQARYTHVPGILEMVGVPYVGSGPLAHSIALDKVVAKMILLQHNLPTPPFVVLEAPGFPAPDIGYPLIVKPRNEAVSFGLKIVNDETELREAADVIFNRFGGGVLAEGYIDGREINVGLLGNGPPEPLPPVELIFGTSGERIYTYEDKIGRSGRTVELHCPAPIDESRIQDAQTLARRAFAAIGCYDCARVDMRMDADGHFHILEINSLPSLGVRGSYVRAAEAVGLDFSGLVNRLVEVASTRYFGTPSPPRLRTGARDPEGGVFSFLTQNRDRMEKRLREWTQRTSRTSDLLGLDRAARELNRSMTDMMMTPVADLTDERSVYTWETAKGFKDGTLLVVHFDVPLGPGVLTEPFRREPEWLYGEGIGTSRAPMVMMEFALRAIRNVRHLRRRRVGVLAYQDEGRDARYSGKIIAEAMSRAARVIVLRPGAPGGTTYSRRRGQRRYSLTAEGEAFRPGRSKSKPETALWLFEKLIEVAKLGSRQERVSASVLNVKTDHFPMLLPHRASATLLVTYGDKRKVDKTEAEVRQILGRDGIKWDLELVSDRPPMVDRRGNRTLLKSLTDIAEQWDIPLSTTSSVWPSVAGLTPTGPTVICGVGPAAKDLYTPRECVQRISLMQRTLLLALFLLSTEE